MTDHIARGSWILRPDKATRPLADSLNNLNIVAGSESPAQTIQILTQQIQKVEDEKTAQIQKLEEDYRQTYAQTEKELAFMKAHLQEIEESAYRQAFERGFSEGFEQGKTDGRTEIFKELDTLITDLRRLSDNAIMDLRESIHNTQVSLAQLSIAVASTLVLNAFHTEPQVFLRFINKLLGELENSVTAKIRLNPDDIKTLYPYWDEIAVEHGWDTAHSHLIPDLTLKKGSCIVESDTNYIDGRIETLTKKVSDIFQETDSLRAIQNPGA